MKSVWETLKQVSTSVVPTPESFRKFVSGLRDGIYDVWPPEKPVRYMNNAQYQAEYPEE